MYVAQDGLLFYPTHTSPAVVDALELDRGASRLEIPRPDATLRGAILPGHGEGRRPTILVFGGNGEAILEKAPALDAVRESLQPPVRFPAVDVEPWTLVRGRRAA